MTWPGAWSSCSATSKDEWLAARLQDLDYGYIDGICAAARKYPLAGVKKDELDTALGYFENNAPACAASRSAQCGLFVGRGWRLAAEMSGGVVRVGRCAWMVPRLR